ncbi:hypothetical protein JCM24511_01990 [Saitozyma sp. JCM 24511]|nr:hypothetical protein JCM24511_01990 [Saitozyma sp. JCM 24511]
MVPFSGATAQTYVDDTIGASPSTASHRGITESRRQPGGAIADYLDPGDVETPNTAGPSTGGTFGAFSTSAPQTQTQPVAHSIEDPVSLGFLSQMEASSLFSYFHRHLNPLIGLLDSNLHTFEYTRATSPPLTTAVLAAASTFTRRDLHPQLLNHNQTILNRAMSNGACDIGIVQSIIISVYWKAPTDRTAWMKIGWAIRMGYQMRWHHPWRTQLPAEERELRMALDPERTWFCLWCLDRSRTFDLPPAIQPDHIGDISRWIENHRQLSIGVDQHLAVSMEQLSLRGQLRWLKSLKTLPREAYLPFLADISDRQRRINERWYGKGNTPRAAGLTEEEARALYWLSLEPKLEILRIELELATSSSDVENILQRSLVTIADIVSEAEGMSSGGILKHLFDFASCILSTLTIFVHDVFRQLTSRQKSYVVTLLKRVHRLCVDVSEGNSEMATAFVARFVQRTLRLLSAESRAVSRMGTPIPETSTAAPQQVVDAPITTTEPFLADLDEFLDTNTFSLPVNPTVDDEYWSSLFLAPFSAEQPARPFWA